MYWEESLNIGPSPSVPDDHVGPHGDLGELATQLVDLGLLLAATCSSASATWASSLLLLVDRGDVVLGEDVRPLLEPLELVGDLLDLFALVLDRIGEAGLGPMAGTAHRSGDDEHPRDR